MSNKNFGWIESGELMELILGIDKDICTDDEVRESMRESGLEAKFGIDEDQFHEVSSSIINLIEVGISPNNIPCFGIKTKEEWIFFKEITGKMLNL